MSRMHVAASLLVLVALAGPVRAESGHGAAAPAGHGGADQSKNSSRKVFLRFLDFRSFRSSP